MRSLALITWHHVVIFVARPAVLIAAVALPLLLALLIHVTFGGQVLGGSIPEKRVPVGIVNLDRGGPWGNLGHLFERALAPSPAAATPPPELSWDLFDARLLANEARARRMVERGGLVAVLIIPAEFSEALSRGQASVLVYVNGGEDLLGSAFASAVQMLADVIASGEIAVRTTASALYEQPQTRSLLRAGVLDEALSNLAVGAALPASNPVQIRRTAWAAQPAGISLAHYMAVAIAILFSGLTALMSNAALYQEKMQRTLQRTYLAPIRPGLVLAAKALATYLLGLTQMVILLGSLIALEALWGSDLAQVVRPNLVGLGVLMLAEVAAATGMGVAVVGLCGNYARASNYGRVLLVLMGLAGGVFFPAALLPASLGLLSRATFHYWAMDGYLQLVHGGGIARIAPHVLILVAMGALSFWVGSYLLRRRLALA